MIEGKSRGRHGLLLRAGSWAREKRDRAPRREFSCSSISAGDLRSAAAKTGDVLPFWL
jgi:hypothetical protein